MKSRKRLMFLCALIAATGGRAESIDLKYAQMRRLLDNVLIFTEVDHSVNQIVIKSHDGLVLIDSGVSPHYAHKLRAAVLDEFDDASFIYLINTHHHWDHVQGNQVFPEAQIIAHEKCPAAMKRQATRSEFAGRAMVEGDAPKNELPPPPPSIILCDGEEGYQLCCADRTFYNRLTLPLGDLTIELNYFGPGHTDNDIIVLIPELKLAMVGDLFYKDSLPQMNIVQNMDMSRRLQLMQRALDKGFDIQIFISGHGDWFSRSTFAAYYQYIHDLWYGVQAQVQHGTPFFKILNIYGLKNNWPSLEGKEVLSNSGNSFHEGNIKAVWEVFQ